MGRRHQEYTKQDLYSAYAQHALLELDKSRFATL